ncbi:uncharacterized protein [Aegilops tauschii subsp. strangulata]|uniref:uncharacterized protein n=1 Tax=Aegilops tauschii subsp. strangulata TaxID=200361 RepID=UPI003CC84CB6
MMQFSMKNNEVQTYKRHLRLQRHKIVGIDLEYNNEPEATQKPTLVQLSVGKTQSVLLFQLSAAERCTVFDNFLADPRYTFAGFSIDGDKTRLELVNLEVANFVDIQKEWMVPEATKELDSLADVSGMLIDDYYNNMKKKITDDEHIRSVREMEPHHPHPGRASPCKAGEGGAPQEARQEQLGMGRR